MPKGVPWAMPKHRASSPTHPQGKGAPPVKQVLIIETWLSNSGSQVKLPWTLFLTVARRLQGIRLQCRLIKRMDPPAT